MTTRHPIDIEIHRGPNRGETRNGWLRSLHSFSFGDWLDPARMGFGPLRVINEDWIAPARGFGPHPHRDMEILTFLLEGALEHGDDRGNRRRVAPGRVQLMHAGRGIVHSEVNPSPDERAHLLQIWIEPDPAAIGGEPGYEEMEVTAPDDGLVALATPSGRQGGLALRREASVHWLRLGAGRSLALDAEDGRRRWIQVTRGRGSVAGRGFEAGDGIAVPDGRALEVLAEQPLEALVFSLD